MRVLLLLLSLLIPTQAFAAIAFDTSTETESSPATSPIAFTPGILTDGLICIGFGSEDLGDNGDITSMSSSGLTWTQAEELVYDPGTAEASSIFCAPAATVSGAQSVSISYDGGVDYAVHIPFSFTGIDQSDYLGATAEETYTSGTTYSKDITTTVANSYVVDCITHNTGTAVLTVGAGQTLIQSHKESGDNVMAACSYEAGGDIGITTMSWTSDSAGLRVPHVIIEILPDVTVPPGDFGEFLEVV